MLDLLEDGLPIKIYADDKEILSQRVKSFEFAPVVEGFNFGKKNIVKELHVNLGGVNIDKISDGYHTFDELYYHRMILFAVICNQNKECAWKSWKHADNTMFDDCFIVGVTTAAGDYSYHYHKDYWDFFEVEELFRAPEWDGHKPEDIGRLFGLL